MSTPRALARLAPPRHPRRMPTLTLYGTVTSPYVRRVRVVALELGLEVDLVDTFTDQGAEQLRALNPIWKVPSARLGEQTLFDSAFITRYLLRHHGPSPMAAWDEDDVALQNLTTVIDGALDALINVFYLAKDDVTPEQASYVAKQEARAESAMGWIDAKLPESLLVPETPLGLPALALYTTVDWMGFRDTYDVSRHPRIVRFMTALADRPSLRETAPPK